MKRFLIISAALVGVSCVSVALGLLYAESVHRESAYDLLNSSVELTDAQRDELIADFRETPFFMPALFSGTAGAALIAAALAGAFFESRFCGSDPGVGL